MSQTVTLLVHGTFAADGKWWRLGGEGETTFADRLESELSRRGLIGSVWKPALQAGFDYSSFAWSGRNRHRDRIKGAGRLRSSLNDLAQQAGATPSKPLTVNFVAHSHGGNVVLEALRGLKPNVRAGRVVLLGTPLVTSKPAFRIGRFVFSTALLALLFIVLIILFIQLGNLFFTCLFGESCRFFDTTREIVKDGEKVVEDVKGIYLVSIAIPMLLAYGWAFWMLGNLLDVAWRVICRLLQPLAWLRGKSSSRVYGPSPRGLARSLGGKPVLLLTTRNDEADLLLQVTSAPARLYSEYVATDFSRLGRLFEFVFLRPFVLGVFLKAGEMLLEVVSLGVSLWRSLFVDFEVVPFDERPYYPPPLLVREELDVRLGANSALANLGPETISSGATQSTGERQRGLRVSLQEVTGEIKRQIQLRHSLYYENPAVIQRIAEFLTGGEVKVVGNAFPSSSLMPSGTFWEALLVGNVALAALHAWIAGAAQTHPILRSFAMGISGYVFPLATVGIILLFCLAVNRRRPLNLWRWFWIIWAAWGLLVLLIALPLRFHA